MEGTMVNQVVGVGLDLAKKKREKENRGWIR